MPGKIFICKLWEIAQNPDRLESTAKLAVKAFDNLNAIAKTTCFYSVDAKPIAIKFCTASTGNCYEIYPNNPHNEIPRGQIKFSGDLDCTIKKDLIKLETKIGETLITYIIHWGNSDDELTL